MHDDIDLEPGIRERSQISAYNSKPMQSKFLSLNWRDVLRGLLVTVLIAVFQIATKLLQDKGLNLTVQDVWPLLDTAVKVGGGYLFVTFFSTKDGRFLGAV